MFKKLSVFVNGYLRKCLKDKSDTQLAAAMQTALQFPSDVVRLCLKGQTRQHELPPYLAVMFRWFDQCHAESSSLQAAFRDSARIEAELKLFMEGVVLVVLKFYPQGKGEPLLTVDTAFNHEDKIVSLGCDHG